MFWSCEESVDQSAAAGERRRGSGCKRRSANHSQCEHKLSHGNLSSFDVARSCPAAQTIMRPRSVSGNIFTLDLANLQAALGRGARSETYSAERPFITGLVAIEFASQAAIFAAALDASSAPSRPAGLSSARNLNRCGASGWQRMRVDLNNAVPDSHRIGRELFGERRRRAPSDRRYCQPCQGQVTQPSMMRPSPPARSDVSRDWTAHRSRCRRERLRCARRRRGNDQRAFVWNRARCAGRNPAVASRKHPAIARAIAAAGDQMQHRHAAKPWQASAGSLDCDRIA